MAGVVERVDVFAGDLGLSTGFRHSSATVRVLEEVYVKLTAADGDTGWGEARGNGEDVTGETRGTIGSMLESTLAPLALGHAPSRTRALAYSMEQVDPEQAGSPELERGFPEKNRAEVKVRVNGVEYVEAVDHPRGDPANRLSDEDLREKFRRLARRRWTSERAEAVIAAVTRLQQAPDLSELSHWLRVDDGGGLPSR